MGIYYLTSMNYFEQETERLLLRKYTESDIEGWMVFFENNPGLRFLGLDLTKTHHTMATEWVAKQRKRYEEQGLGMLLAIHKETGAMVGGVGILLRNIDGKEVFEIGYSVVPTYWGQGYATEMALHMKQFGFANGFHRFISIIHLENEASMMVARKNGMEVLYNMDFEGMEVHVFGVQKE